MTRVTWITFAAPTRAPTGGVTSEYASLRYRVLIPVAAMGQAGFSHRVVASVPGAPDPVFEVTADADLLVFSKSAAVENERIAAAARERGAKVLFDVCDDHFLHPRLGPHYQAMARLADQVVCSTPEMAQAAGRYAAKAPAVIPDPYEGPRGAPRFEPGAVLRLLWFGHPSNLDSLQDALRDLVGWAAAHPLELTILTTPNAAFERACERMNAHLARTFRTTPKPWSLDAQWRALRDCDAVVIPSRTSAQKQVKSANRLVEALWAGRPVAAQPLPAYEPFAAFTPVRPTLSEGLSWLLDHRAEVLEGVAAAQAEIAVRHAPDAIARQWAHVLAAALGKAGVR